jgi:hypothetical protein
MAKDPNESNCIEEIIYKCQWRHWPIFIVGESVMTLATKAKAWKGVGRKCNPIVTFAFSGMLGMNPHTPKWTLILGVRVPMHFWILKKWFQGSKVIGLRTSLYHWKPLKTNVWNGIVSSIWILKTKIMAKWRTKIQNVNLTFDH